MIRINRGDEPPKLKAVRTSELARVGAIASRGYPSADDIGDRFQIVRETIRDRQFGKCAYCEFWEQSKRNDLEHFRPKARADRGPGFPDRPGYWWLAWTWENLFFSCRNCNQPPAKGDQFPLEQGSVLLKPHQQPEGGERRLLLDPAVDDPIDHIQFRPLRFDGREDWLPFARNGSLQGLNTIRVFGLDSDHLRTVYGEHFGRMQNSLRDIRDGLATADAPAVRQVWEKEVFRWLEPHAPFVALSRDVLDHVAPDPVRKRFGLELDVLRVRLWMDAIARRAA